MRTCSLAGVYQAQSLVDQAERLITKSLEIRDRVFGPEHPSTLTAMHNLAALYQHRGRLKDAERLYSFQSLEVSRRVLGPEHRDTLMTAHYLAMTYNERAGLTRPSRCTPRRWK